jgi:CelD/BcsL family acetyltransferase involved in cellulose biosynthesis
MLNQTPEICVCETPPLQAGLIAPGVSPGFKMRPEVERINSGLAFAKLHEQWDELLAESASDCLFHTWEWLFTWWKHLAAGRELSILTIVSGNKLTGIAPFCLRPSNWSFGHPFRVLEFLGCGYVGSDYLDLIVRRGHEEYARTLFASHLATQRLVLKWTSLRRGACFANHIASVLLGQGWRMSDAKINTCPYISLEGKTWESYMASLGSEHRYNFRRKWKALNRDHVVRFEQVATEARCREAVDLLIGQHNQRWRSRGGSDAFHTPELVAFHQEFAPIALRRGWLRLYVLWIDDIPAASLYGFLYRRKFYFYQSGFDAAYEKQSVGLITMGLAIQRAIDERATEYDLLHGDEAYKSHWSRERRDLGRIELYPPGWLGRICQSSIEFARASRRRAGRTLTKTL